MVSRLAMLFFTVILLNVYVCLKYERLISSLNVVFSLWLFRLLYLSVVLSFFASIFYQSALLEHERLDTVVTYYITVYLGLFMFSFVLFAGFDVAFLIGRFLPRDWKVLPAIRWLYADGLSVLLISLLVTFYGIWNVKQIVLKEYDIVINKQSNIDELNIVMVGDFHLGTSIKEKELADIIEKINALSADIVFITGDLVDHATTNKLKKQAAYQLSLINSKYGTYYIFGNHEYYLGDAFAETAIIRSSLNFLYDETALIDNSFYVVGRADVTDRERKSIDALTESLDKDKPIILLDHQPRDIEEAVAGGVDLQLSGHTHKGQIFPFGLLVKAFNGLFYGYYKIGEYQAIVTSGVGAWRFPIRVGSNSEIVYIKARFQKPEA